MKQSTVDAIKADVKRLRAVIEKLAIVWPSDEIDIYLTLLQNLGFSGKGAYGYSLEAEIKRMYDIIDAIQAMEKYNKYHVSSFIMSEVDMVLMGHIQLESEQEEKYIPDPMDLV